MFGRAEKRVFSLAVVTGATSGIGEELCYFLASKGINLLITGRNQERLKAIADRLRDNIKVIEVIADLTLFGDRKKLIETFYELKPDLVINNAGFGLYGEALTYHTEQQLEILKLNAEAVLELSLEAARAMMSNNIKGVIVNISSAASYQVFPNFAVYSASKSFVTHFSEAFDMEMRPYGIRVLTLCPGQVETDFRVRAGGFQLKTKNRSVMSPKFVAEKIWIQIQHGKAVKIIDWKYYLGTIFSYCLPHRFLAKLLCRNIKSRYLARTIISRKKI